MLEKNRNLFIDVASAQLVDKRFNRAVIFLGAYMEKIFSTTSLGVIQKKERYMIDFEV